MQYWIEGMDFEKALAEERPRLVRLCARFTGSQESAEDLAQETLMAAWKNKAQLTSVDKLKPWTSAIARNICLNWSRCHYRERAQVVDPSDSKEELWEDELPDDTSLELDLDRYELSKLLDQALSMLPAETAQLLVDHYIEQSPHAEIAARLKIKPGTVAVRLQRGKLILQRLLRTNLQAESLAFGLIDQNSPTWEETNIWCLSCGETRLVGQYQKSEPKGRFALRCPRCHPDPDMIMVGLDLTKPYNARLLGNTKTFKPAYSRLLTGFAPVYHHAIKFHTVPCLACGNPAEVSIEHEKKTKSSGYQESEIRLSCHFCGWASNKSLSGLVMASPQAQRFWREYPRIKILPSQEIDAEGCMAFVTRIQSISGSAVLEVISKRDTLELLGVHTNVKL
jgi:RNA polymerase sigma factor (sigma-70 family)